MKLFTHQKEIIHRALGQSLALFCEMGTGKTRAILETVKINQQYPCLVVCPASVLSVWESEVEKWLGFIPIMLRGTKARRAKLLELPCCANGCIYVVSFATLRQYNYITMPTNPTTGRRYRMSCNKINDVKAWKTCIVDESSKIKNHKAKQAQACHAFKDVPWRYILSGTPISHSPLDIYSQFKFLHPGLFSTWSEFENEYAVIVRRPIPHNRSTRFTHYNEVVGIKNEEQLYDKIYPYSVNYKKKDCLDLPDKIFEIREVALTAKQRHAYDELVADYITTIGESVVTAANVLTRLLRLQQICQGFSQGETARIIFDKNPKLELLRELLVDLVEHKVIIWCRFRYDVETVLKLFWELKRNPIRFDGSITADQKKQGIYDFQNKPEHRVFVAQIQAGAFGISLTAADYTLYYSQTFELGLYQQSVNRNHRIGQVNKVTYVNLICKGTVDETIANNLKEKKKFQGNFDAKRFVAMTKGK